MKYLQVILLLFVLCIFIPFKEVSSDDLRIACSDWGFNSQECEECVCGGFAETRAPRCYTVNFGNVTCYRPENQQYSGEPFFWAYDNACHNDYPNSCSYYYSDDLQYCSTLERRDGLGPNTQYTQCLLNNGEFGNLYFEWDAEPVPNETATPTPRPTSTPPPNATPTSTPTPTPIPGTYLVSGQVLNVEFDRPAVCPRSGYTGLNGVRVGLYGGSLINESTTGPGGSGQQGAFYFHNTPNGTYNVCYTNIPSPYANYCINQTLPERQGNEFTFSCDRVVVNNDAVPGLRLVVKNNATPTPIPTSTPTPTPIPPTSTPTPIPTNTPTPTPACINPAPTNLQPSGSIQAGNRTITWNGNTSLYALRIDDRSSPWRNNCNVSQHEGDICIDNYNSTSYIYNFRPGKTYDVWVHAQYACNWSTSTRVTVTVTSPPPTLTCGLYNAVNNTFSINTSWYQNEYAQFQLRDEPNTLNPWPFNGWTFPGNNTVSNLPPTLGYVGRVNYSGTASFSTWSTPPLRCAYSTPHGDHQAASCTNTTGWACDGDNFTRSVRVRICSGAPCGAGGIVLGTVTANQINVASEETCGGIPSHGFSFTIPDSLKDGQSHAIYTQALGINSSGIEDGNNAALGNTPKTISGCRLPEWYKIKNSSFHRLTDNNNPIPQTISEFDGDDLPIARYFDSGIAGIVSSVGSQNYGTAPVSQSGFKLEGFTKTNNMLVASFTQYIKSKKEHVTINDLTNLQENIITIYDAGALGFGKPTWTIDNAAKAKINTALSKGNVVIIFDGNLNIDTNITTSGNSLALLVTGNINIRSDVSELNGIFIGNTVDFSYDEEISSTPLKIKGNIIAAGSTAASTNKRQRDVTSQSKPSIFVVFDPSMYLNLLPYLSTSVYEWREKTP